MLIQWCGGGPGKVAGMLLADEGNPWKVAIIRGIGPEFNRFRTRGSLRSMGTSGRKEVRDGDADRNVVLSTRRPNYEWVCFETWNWAGPAL